MSLEFSLTELEMDFHCKEFQLRDLTKLLCSSTNVFFIESLITVISEYLNCHTDFSNLKWPAAYHEYLSGSQNIHLTITSSDIFELWRLLT